MFDEITASSLVKIDIAGNVLQETPFPINPAGFVIHSAVHSARHDAQCVMHTHTLNGVAVSAQKNGVLPISQFSIFVLASLAYHDYEGVALRDDEKPRLVADLGDKTYLMLRNHGLLTVGPTIPAAFGAMYIFETTCAVADPRPGRRLDGGGRPDRDRRRRVAHRHRAGAHGDAEQGPRRADLAGPAAPPRSPRSRLSALTREALPFQQRNGR